MEQKSGKKDRTKVKDPDLSLSTKEERIKTILNLSAAKSEAQRARCKGLLDRVMVLQADKIQDDLQKQFAGLLKVIPTEKELPKPVNTNNEDCQIVSESGNDGLSDYDRTIFEIAIQQLQDELEPQQFAKFDTNVMKARWLFNKNEKKNVVATANVLQQAVKDVLPDEDETESESDTETPEAQFMYKVVPKNKFRRYRKIESTATAKWAKYRSRHIAVSSYLDHAISDTGFRYRQVDALYKQMRIAKPVFQFETPEPESSGSGSPSFVSTPQSDTDVEGVQCYNNPMETASVRLTNSNKPSERHSEPTANVEQVSSSPTPTRPKIPVAAFKTLYKGVDRSENLELLADVAVNESESIRRKTSPVTSPVSTPTRAKIPVAAFKTLYKGVDRSDNLEMLADVAVNESEFQRKTSPVTSPDGRRKMMINLWFENLGAEKARLNNSFTKLGAQIARYKGLLDIARNMEAPMTEEDLEKQAAFKTLYKGVDRSENLELLADVAVNESESIRSKTIPVMSPVSTPTSSPMPSLISTSKTSVLNPISTSATSVTSPSTSKSTAASSSRQFIQLSSGDDTTCIAARCRPIKQCKPRKIIKIQGIKQFLDEEIYPPKLNGCRCTLKDACFLCLGEKHTGTLKVSNGLESNILKAFTKETEFATIAHHYLEENDDMNDVDVEYGDGKPFISTGEGEPEVTWDFAKSRSEGDKEPEVRRFPDKRVVHVVEVVSDSDESRSEGGETPVERLVPVKHQKVVTRGKSPLVGPAEVTSDATKSTSQSLKRNKYRKPGTGNSAKSRSQGLKKRNHQRPKPGTGRTRKRRQTYKDDTGDEDSDEDWTPNEVKKIRKGRPLVCPSEGTSVSVKSGYQSLKEKYQRRKAATGNSAKSRSQGLKKRNHQRPKPGTGTTRRRRQTDKDDTGDGTVKRANFRKKQELGIDDKKNSAEVAASGRIKKPNDKEISLPNYRIIEYQPTFHDDESPSRRKRFVIKRGKRFAKKFDDENENLDEERVKAIHERYERKEKREYDRLIRDIAKEEKREYDRYIKFIANQKRKADSTAPPAGMEVTNQPSPSPNQNVDGNLPDDPDLDLAPRIITFEDAIFAASAIKIPLSKGKTVSRPWAEYFPNDDIHPFPLRKFPLTPEEYSQMEME